MSIYLFDVKEGEIGIRLDVFITQKVGKLSRSYVKKIINDGYVNIKGAELKPNYRLKKGDRVEVIIPELVEPEIKAENIKLNIIYEDDNILIINKPQGMVVHPAHGNYSSTLVNALLYYCTSLSRINGIKRPGIVHRIDKDTSGLIMVAKTNEAHNALSKQLKEYRIKRRYIALLEGRINNKYGKIDKPIGRNPIDRKRMAVIYKNCKEAVTYYKVLEYFNNNTLIEARLETGRTHQIRVHMSYLGFPIVGDSLYGYKRQKFNLKGQLLHAYSLGLFHPITNEFMEFNAPLPSYFKETIEELRQGGSERISKLTY